MSGEHRAPRAWFRRAARGRVNQPEHGRHTLEYVANHQGRGVGMFPVGAAGRETFAQFMSSPAHRDA